MKKTRKVFKKILIFLASIVSIIVVFANANDTYSQPPYIEWLEKQSLLYNAEYYSRQVSGNSIQWHHPFALPETKLLAVDHSVWFYTYPSAIITHPNENIFQFLGNDQLWATFSKIGINVLHFGPVKISGGIVKKHFTPTVDGWYDRIQFKVDPAFGTEEQYKKIVTVAMRHKEYIAGDIIPGHTGMGADFLLAERAYKDYPGLYSMVEIKEEDWKWLPPVQDEWHTANLSQQQVAIFTHKGYLPGCLEWVMYSPPDAIIKPTGWDTTGIITGADGKKRRWIYLHYFKPGQPTLNWLDPSHAAQRVLAGDILVNILDSNILILRIDANAYLGLEPRPLSLITWSENHPLSVQVTNSLAWLIRKLGGWSFQELNSSLEAFQNSGKYGTDFSYDFITRPAVEHALLTGDASFLRLMMQLMQQYKITPNSLIHDLQNHDDITYELPHLTLHGNDKFNYKDKILSGRELHDLIFKEMKKTALSTETPYNKLGGNGLCTTFIGLIGARLKIHDIYNLTDQQKKQIQKAHFLLAVFNAMQPGIFSISGWDLVGALPLSIRKNPKNDIDESSSLMHRGALLGALPLDTKKIKSSIVDDDPRWVNRGAYDLLGVNPKATASSSGIPRAASIYGSLSTQLKNPTSFVSQIKWLISMRNKYHLATANLIALPPVKHDEAVIMIHQLEQNKGIEITAINFGNDSVEEKIELLPLIKAQHVYDIFSNKTIFRAIKGNTLLLHLPPMSSKLLLLT